MVRGGHRRPPSENPRLIWRNVSPCGQAERFGDNGSLFYWFATNDWSTARFPSISIRLPRALASLFVCPSPQRSQHRSGVLTRRAAAYFAPAMAQRRARADDRTRTGSPFQTALGTYATADWCANSDVLIVSGYAPNRIPHLPRERERLVGSAAADRSIAGILRGTRRRGDRSSHNDPSGAPAHAIVRRSMAAGSETVLFNENRRVSALARAFDGSQLAFVVHDKDAARLVTMPAGGGAISSNLMTTGYFGGKRPAAAHLGGRMDARWPATSGRSL